MYKYMKTFVRFDKKISFKKQELVQVDFDEKLKNMIRSESSNSTIQNVPF